MKILKKADPAVKTVLGPQRPGPECARVRLSRHVYCSEKTHVLFHELTRQMIALNPEEWEQLEDLKGGIPAAEAAKGFPEWLFSYYYLVPEKTQEAVFYEQLRTLMGLTGPPAQGFSSYVILPTTACNARCVYCYEESFPVISMNRETAEQTLRFILNTRKKGKIRLHWFGGEPLAGTDVIRLISGGLQAAGVSYDSEMISNGSLFTEELIREAKASWHLRKVQISLDGEKNEYLKRKCYAAGPEDPYETVLKNVRSLLEAGIQVSLRCNCDRNNLDSMAVMILELAQRFSPWYEKMAVYFCPLNEEYTGEDFPGLYAKLMQLTTDCRRLGFRTGIQGFSSSLRRHHCMADRPHEQCLIDPKGTLRDCEHLPRSHVLGNVWQGLSEKAVEDALKESRGPRAECKDCVFLPECTPYTGCPLTIGACREINILRLENVIQELLEKSADEKNRVNHLQTEAQPLC